jgi:hypothetical protein
VHIENEQLFPSRMNWEMTTVNLRSPTRSVSGGLQNLDERPYHAIDDPEGRNPKNRMPLSDATQEP